MCLCIFFLLFFRRRSSLFDNEELLADHPNIILSPHVLDSVGYINNLPSPRFIKTHLPFNLLPEKLQNGSTSAKVYTYLIYFYELSITEYLRNLTSHL